MRKFTPIVSAALMLICAATANAQTEGAESTSFISNLISGGYNQANISYTSQSFHTKFDYGKAMEGAMAGEDLNDDYNTTSLQGFGIEYIRGFKVSKKLPMFIEAGLNLNFTFGKNKELKSQHLGMNIPISFAYKFNIKNKFTIKPYAGIDLKVGLLGRSCPVDDNEWYSWYGEGDDEDDAWKRFNLGWHLGADFQYLRYSIGFNFVSDITHVYNCDLYKVSNSVFALKLGYTF